MTEYIIITIDGKEVKCPIIFTYESKEFGHKYVVFRHGDTDELSAMIYVEKDDKTGTLMPIENDDEWDHIEEVVNDYFDEQAKHHHHHEGCHCEDCDGCSEGACSGEEHDDCDCCHNHDCQDYE